MSGRITTGAAGDRSSLWPGVVAFVAVLVAYCVLALSGVDPDRLTLAAVPILSALGIGVHFERRTKEQNEKLDVIEHQTNGVLDRKIHEGTIRAVRQVLSEAGYAGVPDPSDPIPPQTKD